MTPREHIRLVSFPGVHTNVEADLAHKATCNCCGRTRLVLVLETIEANDTPPQFCSECLLSMVRAHIAIATDIERNS